MTRPTLSATTLQFLAALLMAPMTFQTAFAADTVVIAVRHAEKGNDDPRDPGLTALGRARAEDLAEALKGSRLAAVYTSQFKRTQLTGKPSAAAQGFEVEVLPISGSSEDYAANFKARLLAKHAGQTVLVVGHSNTVPVLVEVLGGQAAEAMPESEFDRFTVIIIPEQGEPRVVVSRY